MDNTQIIILGIAAVTSAVIKNGTAVGAGIFLLPVLALAFPPKIALGLGAPVMLASDFVGLRNYWREWCDWKEILRLILAGGLGIASGAFLIHVIPAHLFKMGIGLYATGFAVYQLAKDLIRAQRLRRGTASPPGTLLAAGGAAAVGIGYLGGVATVLAHAGGVVWSAYFLARKLDKRCFVGSLILLLTLSDMLKIVTYVQLGILDFSAIAIILAMSPVVILSSNLGNWLNKKVSPALFRAVVLVFILAVGIKLVIS